MQLEQVVGTIVAAEGYRRMRYRHMSRIALGLILTLCLSLFGITVLANKPVIYQYILTEIDGKLSKSVPLDRANMSDENIKTWASTAITQVYTFDFANWRAHTQEVQKYLTVYGLNQFLESLRLSGNYTSIMENKYVLTAAPTGPATITSKGTIPIDGGEYRYVWKVEIPIVITYRSSVRDITQRLLIKATVGRMPERGSDGSGLGIRQILAQ